MKKKILITGHTGFVGTWLYFFLKTKKIDVYGLGLKPQKNSLFHLLKLKINSNSKIINILDKKTLENYIKKIKPNIIIHLAAQSLVLTSYKKPLETIDTNFNGTVNILNLIKKFKFLKTGIFFTTDKVYKNEETKKKFKENDNLGGDDPYSASKSASEIIINCFSKSFFKNKKIVVLRCGNILGLGDHNKNRIIPDIIKTIKNKKILKIRNPYSVRPWQSVLDVIFITYYVLKKIDKKKYFFDTYNISPSTKTQTVKNIVDLFKKYFSFKVKIIESKNNREKKNLTLNSKKIFKNLKIKNLYSTIHSVKQTAKLYEKKIKNNMNLNDLMKIEIDKYERKAKNI